MSASAITGADARFLALLSTLLANSPHGGIFANDDDLTARLGGQGKAGHNGPASSNKRSKRYFWRIDEAIHCSPGHDHEPGACHRRVCANARQGRQGRKSRRPVRPLRRYRRSRLDRRRADGDRGFRAARQGLEDRRDRGRSPEQARRRHQHRQAVDRRREGRRVRRSRELRRRPRHCQPCQGKERRQSELRLGVIRSHRRAVLAEHDPLGLRHLDARQRHRQGAGEIRRRQLVLPHRGLRLRSRARTRHGCGRHRQWRQGARRRQASAQQRRLLLVPAAGAKLEGQDHRARQRRRRHHQLDQAGGGVRHRRRAARSSRAC